MNTFSQSYKTDATESILFHDLADSLPTSLCQVTVAFLGSVRNGDIGSTVWRNHPPDNEVGPALTLHKTHSGVYVQITAASQTLKLARI